MNPKNKKRIPKTVNQRLRDCETHLYFLWDALRLYPRERDRFKQVAGVLRVLVCETKKNKPILLDLMDEFQFSHEIEPLRRNPDGPPVKAQPIPMIGWQNDPIHKRLARQISEAIKSGDKTELDAIKAELEARAAPMSFRDYVNKGLAVYIAPYDYSYKELVLTIAQQFGSSHEDDSIEEPVVRMQGIIIGGETSEVVTMIRFAEVVVDVGTKFVGHLVLYHEYKPRYFLNKV